MRPHLSPLYLFCAGGCDGRAGGGMKREWMNQREGWKGNGSEAGGGGGREARASEVLDGGGIEREGGWIEKGKKLRKDVERKERTKKREKKENRNPTTCHVRASLPFPFSLRARIATNDEHHHVRVPRCVWWQYFESHRLPLAEAHMRLLPQAPCKTLACMHPNHPPSNALLCRFAPLPALLNAGAGS